MLGFELSERSISRWMKRAPRDPDRANWLAFLRNHREAIAAMDFFTVPTITFGVLYCFFVISHDRRRILHVNVTKHPTSAWITQQLREAFPFERHLKRLLSVTIMRTARISDLRRGRLRAEFVPKLRVGSLLRSDSAGCTIVTIEKSLHRKASR
jgi:hypothetical protein